MTIHEIVEECLLASEPTIGEEEAWQEMTLRLQEVKVEMLSKPTESD